MRKHLFTFDGDSEYKSFSIETEIGYLDNFRDMVSSKIILNPPFDLWVTPPNHKGIRAEIDLPFTKITPEGLRQFANELETFLRNTAEESGKELYQCHEKL